MDLIKKQRVLFSSIVISSYAMFSWFTLVAFVTRLNYLMTSFIKYIIGLGIFGIVFAASVFVFTKIYYGILIEKVVLFFSIIGSLGWLILAYFYEIKQSPYAPKEYLRHNMPYLVYIIILLSVTVATTYVLGLTQVISEKQNQSMLLRKIISFVLVLLQSMLLYVPNIFQINEGMKIYHVNAYINSIVNTFKGTPFELWNTSIYGHYGLLYFFPVSILKVFGLNQWHAITLSIAFVGALTFVCQVYVFDKVIKNDFLFFLAIVANSVVSMQLLDSIYYQLNPHRFLFPAIMLAIMVSKKKQIHLWGWGIIALAILWNLDTGIICAVTLWAYNSYKRRNQGFARAVAIELVKLILSFAAAYLLVNIYNLCVGGEWNSLKTFVYPMGNGEYNITPGDVPLGSGFREYFIVLVLFAGVLFFYLKDYVCGLLDDNHIIIYCSAIMGCGLFTYYMNRPVNTNASIIAFEFVLILAWVVELCMTSDFPKQKKLQLWHMIKYRVWLLMTLLFVLDSMVLSAVGSAGKRLNDYYKNDYTFLFEGHDLEVIRCLLPKEIKDENILFVGAYVGVITSVLDRDNGINIIDFEDMNNYGVEHLQKELSLYKWDYIICNDNEMVRFIPSDVLEGENYNKIAENDGYSLYIK